VPLDQAQDRGGVVLAGVRLRVDTGRATRFDDVRTDDEVISGRVVAVDDASPVPGGTVLVTVGQGDDETTTVCPVEGGVFRTSRPAPTEPVRVCYLPVPGYADYRTPVKGLYMCGAATHPGGGVMGACGYNAAREILKDG